MIVDIDDRIARLLAERHFANEPARDWAIRCLEAGYDSRSLRMLAGMSQSYAPSEIDEKLDLALKELGWADIPPYVYLIGYARIIAKEILEDKIDPMMGSYEMYKVLVATDSYSELNAWYDIDEMIWDQTHFGNTGKKGYYYRERDQLVATIKEACTNFLTRTRSNIGSLSETSFEEAEEAFRNFLADNEAPTELLWVFREDVIPEGYGNMAIRTPLPTDNHERAKKCFELGKKRNLGVAFLAFCKLDGATCCFVQLPEDDRDAQYKSMGNRYLKLSRTTMPEARAISNSVLWKIRELFVNRKDYGGWDDMIPSRETLLPISYRKTSVAR